MLSGDLTDNLGSYPPGTWIRNPPGDRHRLGSDRGSVYWVKRNHLHPMP